MASRFWVLDTGTWDASDTTHWSASSGGLGGQSVPVDGDTVTFDANSCLLSGTVTLGYSPTVTSITCGAFTGTFNASTFSPTMDTFSASGTGVRTINLGSGTWTLRGSSTTAWQNSTTTNETFSGASAVLNFTGSNVTFNGGTKTYKDVSFTGGGTMIISNTTNTFNNFTYIGVGSGDILKFSSNNICNGTFTITGNSAVNTVAVSSNVAGTVQNMQFNAASFTNVSSFTDYSLNKISTGTWTLNENLLLVGTGVSKTVTLTQGTFNANDKNITCDIFSSSNSNTRVLTMRSGTWTLTGNATTIWNTNTITNLTFSGASATIVCNYAGATGTRTIATGGSSLIFGSLTISGGTDIIGFSSTTNAFAGNINFTGFSGNTTTASATFSVGGNLTWGVGMTTTTGSGTWTFNGTSGTQTITSNGVQFNHPITINATAGVSIRLADNLDMGGASARTLTVTQGTLDTTNNGVGNYSVTCGSFSSSNSNTRVITLGSSTITLTGTGTVWTTATTTGLTLNQGTSTIKISDGTAASKTFSGGGKTFYNLLLSGAGTGAFIIVGNNTLNKLYNDSSPITVQFTAGSTTTVSANQFITGTLGSPNVVQSTSGGSPWNIVAASGQVVADFITLSDSVASGGASFYAGSHSTNVSGNSGWIFTQSLPSAQTAGRDSNQVDTLLCAADSNGTSPVTSYVNPQTHGLFVSDGTTGSVVGNSNASRDANSRPVLMAVSSADGSTPVQIYCDAVSHSILVKST